MQVEFSSAHYNDPASQLLKPRLEAFFNRGDIQQKLQAAAQYILQDGKLRENYALSSPMLGIFNGETAHDGDPYNLSYAVIVGYRDIQADQHAPAMIKAGLESVAKQLVAIADLTATNSELKTEIMRAATRTGITGKEKF